MVRLRTIDRPDHIQPPPMPRKGKSADPARVTVHVLPLTAHSRVLEKRRTQAAAPRYPSAGAPSIVVYATRGPLIIGGELSTHFWTFWTILDPLGRKK